MTTCSETRSRTMRAVRSKNTKPEIVVRKLVHAMGYRFRLHRKDLPGSPDLAFPGRRQVVFVHGCFWHGHDCKRGAREPKANAEYWRTKLKGNRNRDERVAAELVEQGWQILTIWECELRDRRSLHAKLGRFLDTNQKAGK